MEEDGIEGAVLFSVREYDHSKIFLGNQHDAGDESPDASGVPDELAAVIVAQSPAQSVVREVGLQSGENWWKIVDRKDGLGGPHLFGALLAEQVASSVGELTAIQLQLYPLRHVCGTGINGACRPGVVEVFEGKNLQFALDARVRVGTILAGLDIGVGDVGVVHAERREDVLANIVIPGSAGHRGDDLSSSHVEQIVIGIVAAVTGGGLHETQPVDDFFARVGG